jgi:hypothetical protein
LAERGTRSEQQRIANILCQQYSALWHLAEALPSRGQDIEMTVDAAEG